MLSTSFQRLSKRIVVAIPEKKPMIVLSLK